MKKVFLGVLDWFIPPAIKKLDQSEELDRARALICVLLFVVTYLCVPTFAYPFSAFLQNLFHITWLFAIYLSLLTTLIALILFKRSGNFVLSSNIFALGAYLAAIITAFNVNNKENFVLSISLLLVLPVLMVQIANYLSGALWWLIIVVTPFALQKLGYPVENSWLVTWTIIMAGLFFASYIGHYYRESMSVRLRRERGQFEFAASHDALTELANRVTFDHRLESCLEECTNYNDSAVLIYIDLDRFKPINDNYGHHAGDRVLVAVSKRLSDLVRRSDTVARLGGDEFAILFEHCSLNEIEPLIQKIPGEVARPIKIDSAEITVSCSMGVVSCPDDGVDSESLYLIADQRMYDAKKNGDITIRK